MSWNYERLPKSMISEVKKLYEENNYRKLIDIHNNFALSPFTYCCENLREGFFAYIKLGLETAWKEVL